MALNIDPYTQKQPALARTRLLKDPPIIYLSLQTYLVIVGLVSCSNLYGVSTSSKVFHVVAPFDSEYTLENVGKQNFVFFIHYSQFYICQTNIKKGDIKHFRFYADYRRNPLKKHGEF